MSPPLIGGVCFYFLGVSVGCPRHSQNCYNKIFPNFLQGFCSFYMVEVKKTLYFPAIFSDTFPRLFSPSFSRAFARSRSLFPNLPELLQTKRQPIRKQKQLKTGKSPIFMYFLQHFCSVFFRLFHKYFYILSLFSSTCGKLHTPNNTKKSKKSFQKYWTFSPCYERIYSGGAHKSTTKTTTATE